MTETQSQYDGRVQSIDMISGGKIQSHEPISQFKLTMADSFSLIERLDQSMWSLPEKHSLMDHLK